MQDQLGEVTGGVDTHSRVHVAAVVNAIGKILATASFAVSAAGYGELLAWMRSFGTLKAVGLEGTGSYGAGLCRFLTVNDVTVIEVNRPNRQLRRRRGKSDSTDAESAARAVLNGEATGVPKTSDGNVEALRALRVARRSAVKATTQASNQIRDLIITAPDGLRDRLVGLSTRARIELCARMRPGAVSDVGEATKRSLRCLARRHEALTAEIAELDDAIHELCVTVNPRCSARVASDPRLPPRCSSQPATTPNGCGQTRRSQRCADPVPSKPHPARPPDTASTKAGTATRTTPSGES